MTRPPQPPIVPGAPAPSPDPHSSALATPKRRIHPGSIILTGFGSLLTIIGVTTLGAAAAGGDSGAAVAGSSPSPVVVYVDQPAASSAAPTPATTTTTTTTKPAPPPAPTIEEGTWTVGADFPAGRYRTIENVSGDCYWGIYKSGTNGEDIIANDIPGGGRPTVTLKVGQDFNTQGCGTWKKF